MAAASSSMARSLALFHGPLRPSTTRVAVSSPPHRLFAAVRLPRLVACARRGKKASPATDKPTEKKNKKSLALDDEADMDEDAFEKLFSLLEEDLKNDDISLEDLDEISAEELAELERELAAALDEEEDDDGNDDDDESEDEEELSLPKLRNWQLRRLASALKKGRRKTNIKSLSAELGLDRAVVLECLRDPPPNLLLMAATLPDKPAKEEAIDPIKEDAPEEPMLAVPAAEPEPPTAEAEKPVHALKTQWSANRRLKKVQLETLERVYSRTKRPTNTMISSIVHTTNLPWKTVVKWFEEKRLNDGEPERPRRPFRRSDQPTVFS